MTLPIADRRYQVELVLDDQTRALQTIPELLQPGQTEGLLP
jgi:hypothetical protein